jgi:hypothetical protein
MSNILRSTQFGSPGIAPQSLGIPTAAYPGRLATDSDLIVAVDRQQTILLLPLGTGDNTMTVLDASMIQAYNLLSIDNEIVKSTGAPTGNVIPVSRGFDGTVPAVHFAGTAVAGLVDAYHHNGLVAEIKAIEQALGPGLSNISTSQSVVSTDYKFGPVVSGAGVSVSGGNLVVGNNVLTFAIVPKGVNGTDVDHYLWIANGTGTAEAVKITGGSGVAGQANGQIIVNCGFTHSGAWSVESASAGIAEACSVVGTRSGGSIQIPPGTHEMRATVRVTGFTTIRGVGQYNTRLHRTGNYGNTFVMGFSNVGVDNVLIEDVFFYHELGFTTGAPPVVLNKPTSGAHCQVNGGNTISFRRCRFQDLVTGINILGGAQIMIDDCVFQGLWSPAYPAGQVTVADIQISNDATLGTATYIKIRGCQLTNGYRGPANEVWGSRFRVLVNGVEDLEILGGAVAAAAVNSIQLLSLAGGGVLGQVRITAGVRFDGSTGADINVTNDGSGQVGHLSVVGCQFNGQRLGLSFPYSVNAIFVADNGSGANALVGLEVSDNEMFNYDGPPVRLQDGLNFLIADNIIYMYNLHGFTDLTASGILIGGRANNGLIQGNLIGGDNTGANAYGVGNNKCLFGIGLLGPPTSVTLVDNYAPFFTAIGTPTDSMFAAYTSRSYFIATETGANNAIAASYAGLPPIPGITVSVRVAHSLQAGANTFNLNGTGAKPIRSSYNPNLNIANAYVVNAVINLQYDGTNWLDLSQ